MVEAAATGQSLSPSSHAVHTLLKAQQCMLFVVFILIWELNRPLLVPLKATGRHTELKQQLPNQQATGWMSWLHLVNAGALHRGGQQYWMRCLAVQWWWLINAAA